MMMTVDTDDFDIGGYKDRHPVHSRNITESFWQTRGSHPDGSRRQHENYWDRECSCLSASMPDQDESRQDILLSSA